MPSKQRQGWYPKPYNTNAGRKKAASLFQQQIVVNFEVSLCLLQGISQIDKELYSEKTRNELYKLLAPISTSNLIKILEDPEKCRKHLYRFYVKGSNALPLLGLYLKRKYTDFKEPFPTLFLSDFDTSILINPTLTHTEFALLHNYFITFIENELIKISIDVGKIRSYHPSVKYALLVGEEKIHTDSNYVSYRKYTFSYNEIQSPLHIIKEFDDVARVSGIGTVVTSNRDPSGSKKFYLGRIFVNIVASRDIRIPVELMDVSMNYQNDDLVFAWDSYSEYHIHIEEYGVDLRIISATSLYTDLVKCLYDAFHSKNESRKNKVPARVKRIEFILDSLIVPYKESNATIKANIDAHRERNDLLGSIYRRMNVTRKNRKPQEYYESSEENVEGDTIDP